jgi:hypothetical protein
MALPVDLSALQIMQTAAIIGTEAVTYVSVRDGGNVSAVVLQAKRTKISRKELLAYEGLFTARDSAWRILASVLADPAVAIEPREGDQIIQADLTTWLITGEGIDRIVQGTVWHLLCKRKSE